MFIFKNTVGEVKTSAQRLSSKGISSVTETPSSFIPEVVYEDSECAVPTSLQNNGSKMETYASSTFMSTVVDA